MAAPKMEVNGLGQLPVNPSKAEQEALLARGHSYIAQVDLASSGISSNNGVLVPYAGFGLYLMHQQTPLNTILEVRFDQDYGNVVAFRRGTLHKPGPVQLKRQVKFFDHFWAKVVQSGDQSGTAYFLVLGAPEAIYWEESGAIPYQPTATSTNVGATIANVLASIQIPTLRNGRLYVQNNGATALVSAPVEISLDNSVWEEIAVGQFANLAASTPLSMELPEGIRYLRMRAATASSSTSITAGLVGTMG